MTCDATTARPGVNTPTSAYDQPVTVEDTQRAELENIAHTIATYHDSHEARLIIDALLAAAHG